MSNTALPTSLQEVRFVYELDPQLEDVNERAELGVGMLPFVMKAEWSASQAPVMDVHVFILDADLDELHKMDRTIRAVIRNAGARIIE